MNYKHSCVVDSAGNYKTFVLVLLIQNEDGTVTPKIQSYALNPGDELLDAPPPCKFIKPRLEVTAWIEAATPEEIAEWEADHPNPFPITLDSVKTAKLAELGQACKETIHSGMDVGDLHYALTSDDQDNINGLISMVAQGAPSVPYHADGETCRPYSATEFAAVASAAMAFKIHHTTLCNHLNVWVRRCVSIDEVQAITYSSPLPDDLQANFDMIVGAANAQSN